MHYACSAYWTTRNLARRRRHAARDASLYALDGGRRDALRSIPWIRASAVAAAISSRSMRGTARLAARSRLRYRRTESSSPAGARSWARALRSQPRRGGHLCRWCARRAAARVRKRRTPPGRRRVLVSYQVRLSRPQLARSHRPFGRRARRGDRRLRHRPRPARWHRLRSTFLVCGRADLDSYLCGPQPIRTRRAFTVIRTTSHTYIYVHKCETRAAGAHDDDERKRNNDKTKNEKPKHRYGSMPSTPGKRGSALRALTASRTCACEKPVRENARNKHAGDSNKYNNSPDAIRVQ